MRSSWNAIQEVFEYFHNRQTHYTYYHASNLSMKPGFSMAYIKLHLYLSKGYKKYVDVSKTLPVHGDEITINYCLIDGELQI